MSNFLELIRNRFSLWRERRSARLYAMRQMSLDSEARRAVQVMEYNGELYVSVNGVPLFGAEDISGDFTDAVLHGRELYKDWKEDKLWEQKGTTGVFTVF
jgi:hypothetical protein